MIHKDRMKWRMKKLILLGIITLIVVIPVVMSASVIIREGACQGNETFLFSIFQQNDTHIGSSLNFFNYSVCYPESISINLRTGNCGSGENFILGLYQQNDTHISIIEGYFNYSLCSPNIICGVPPSCSGTTIGSLYQTDDSHWGDINYFNNTLCCVKFPEVTSIGGGEVLIDVEDVEEPEVEEKIIFPLFSILGLDKIEYDEPEFWGIMLILFFLPILFIFIYKKKERCYYCRKKFKPKDLLLYKNKNCCKSCYKLKK